MRVLITICALSFAVTACVNVEATTLNRFESLAAVPVDQVIIYRTPDQIGQPYREIALLEAHANGDLTSEHDFFNSMRRKAAKLGANGIILEPGLEPGPLLRTAQLALGVEYTRYRHAIAIRTENAR